MMQAPASAPATRLDRLGGALVGLAGLLVYLFLYLPLIILVLYSFSSSAINSWPIPGWTLNWYRQLGLDDDLLTALVNSLTVAARAVVVAVVLGTLAALAVHRYQFPGRGVFLFVATLPIVLPGIVTGIAMLLFFSYEGVQLSLTTVLIGHATFCIVLVLNNVLARLVRVPRELDEAAGDLGANRLRAFWHVTLPSIRTAMLSGALLAFTLSFDEVVVTYFLTGRDNTLPMEIYGRLRRGFTPEINAIATVVIAASLVLVVLAQTLTKEQA
jgi:spermidine/putrescine transport system permease protein